MTRYQRYSLVIMVIGIVISIIDGLIAYGVLDKIWKAHYERKYFSSEE